MPDTYLSLVEIDALETEKADQLLRRVLHQAGLKPGDEPPPTAETRQTLQEVLQKMGQDPLLGYGAPQKQFDEVLKQALQVLAQDPVYCNLLTRQNVLNHKPSEATRDFVVDPISFVGVSTLAMIVLTTYVAIKRDSKGNWTFEFTISPSTKVQAALIELVKRLISILPKS